MERTSPTGLYAFTFAVLAGVLAAPGHLVAGGVLAALAVACLWAWRNRDDDERGIY